MTVEANQDGAEVVVADTGPGIPPENLPHVFNPYWQARQHVRVRAAGGIPRDLTTLARSGAPC